MTREELEALSFADLMLRVVELDFNINHVYLPEEKWELPIAKQVLNERMQLLGEKYTDD